MALVVADRVQETTTTTGQGTVTLAGASAGYQSFATIGNGNTTYYTLTSGNNWEVGIGTYASSGTTLARTTVLASSAGGTTKITLSGTSNAFVTYPAEISTMIGTPSTVGTSGGYQFLQSAGASAPTWVQIPSFKDVATAPTSPTPIEGDRFFDNTTGIDYTYITDVDGSQWVETAPGNLASVAGGSSTQVQYNNAGILGGITGATTNGTVLTLTTPVLGAATGTSLALGGATLGSNALAVTGTTDISSTLNFGGFAAEGTVTAATTTNLGTSTANRQSVSGSTTITGFGTSANSYRIIRFTGNPLITYNATTLITPTAANIQAAAGDMAVLTSDGSGNWTIISYTRGVAPLSSAFAGVVNSSSVTYTSLSLTPGKWLLSANALDNSGSGGRGFCGIGTSAASPTAGTFGVDYITYAIDSSTGSGSCALINKVVTLTATTTYYCSGLSTASSPAGWGNFRAQPIY